MRVFRYMASSVAQVWLELDPAAPNNSEIRPFVALVRLPLGISGLLLSHSMPSLVCRCPCKSSSVAMDVGGGGGWFGINKAPRILNQSATETDES